jgi:hypothetical protein
MVNWTYPSSPFYKKHKREMRNVDLTEAMNLASEETNIESHILLELMEIEWTELNWFNKIIFEKYMVLGSLKKVSKDTTIPLASVGRYIKETKEIIKANTISKYENL